MREEMSTPFLPLGSILRLEEPENDQILYVVVARAIAKNEMDAIFSRYKVAPHPFGDVPSQEVFTISADQIAEVIFEGYSDQNDQEFLEDLLVKMANGPIVVPEAPEPEVIQEPEPILDEAEQLQEDPFYKFRE
ncbi:hypothetical protein BCR22_02615 [Enterococcus plantarum]|uniref:DUF4176 domain-containing protein n=1 Tax=Enterococcus haemoperoxidus ATCC BAA-382 TaxID=1158608 RepID=R2QKT4_9ENTE|nr:MULTISPECIES: DUF4176 domain-containing protein [Enterococcus]EOH97197.1 hypothetical protein UAW_01679 [Enterococcus haemoperoxidus ATCC BAA-382]EOT60010.1 hypothetical protein I583_02645 [Enterococcus haemoperoxidus ATCC BAA-382]OEG17568.1 hypothetical protein BCR22_02615 [Enterococcus plantarum]